MLFANWNCIVLKSISNMRISAKITGDCKQLKIGKCSSQLQVMYSSYFFLANFTPISHVIKHRQPLSDCTTRILTHIITQRSIKLMRFISHILKSLQDFSALNGIITLPLRTTYFIYKNSIFINFLYCSAPVPWYRISQPVEYNEICLRHR